MSHKPTSPFLFIIDTADYSGNFEREMCAYITGHIGDCGVGDEMSELFKQETGRAPLANVGREPDEEGGCWRPATIYPTPGWFNHGGGGHFEDKPENEALALEAYKAAERSYHGNSLYHRYLAGWQAGKNIDGLTKAGWTEEKLKAAALEEEKIVEKAEALITLPHKYPAYQSVCVSFSSKPSDEDVALMKARAHTFAALPQDTYGFDVPTKPRVSRILGFRLIQQTITVTTESHPI